MKTLKYAARFLMRAKSYTIINLLGLAFSLACCIILMRYIHRELTVDTHCVDRENVYAVVKEQEGNRQVTEIHHEMGDEKYRIETRAKLSLQEQEYFTINQSLHPTNVLVADSNFFKLFDYRVLQGNSKQETPESAVLTEEYAQRIFGQDNPIGKVLIDPSGKEAIVTGVIAKPNHKSFIHFDVVLASSSRVGKRLELLRFIPETDIKQMKEVFGQTRYDYYDQKPHSFTCELLSLKDLYWSGLLDTTSSFNHGNRSQISLLVALCFLIGIIGIVNFVNLYLMLVQKRRKEYGLKKVFGIKAKSLFLQVWLENLLLIFCALMVAGLLLEVCQLPIKSLLSLPFGYTQFEGWLFIGFIVLLPLVTSIYPFLKCYYSAPISSIRNIGSCRESVRGRMAFLFLQYVFTCLLIVLSLYFNKQLSLLQNTHPGFRTENVMIAQLGKVWTNISEEQRENPFFGLGRIQTMVEKIRQCPVVEHIEASSILAPFGMQQTYLNDNGEKCELYTYFASPEFFCMYGIPFVEGRLPETREDEGYGDYQHWVANRSAMKALGYISRKDGKIIKESTKTGNEYAEASSIIAVVEDYYDEHLSKGSKPILFQVREDISFAALGTYQIAYSAGRLNDLTKALHEIQQEIFGAEDFAYTLLKDEVKALYDEDRKIATVYTVFAFIAIAISCLGLFGISLFDIRQRYREIGIRKVNGAGMKDLYKLLFRKYMVVLGIAFVVAAPIAYYLIHEYTADFVVKAPIGIGIFVIALLIVSLISLGTLFWQVRKAANINPAYVVKSE